jgi:hypothetical protein
MMVLMLIMFSRAKLDCTYTHSTLPPPSVPKRVKTSQNVRRSRLFFRLGFCHRRRRSRLFFRLGFCRRLRRNCLFFRKLLGGELRRSRRCCLFLRLGFCSYFLRRRRRFRLIEAGARLLKTRGA